MSRLFGTDGIRGIANTELSCELAVDIAKATAVVVEREMGYFPKVLVGMDTRVSAGMLEAAIYSALCSVGSNVVNLGVVPTPAVAYLVKEGFGDVGIMISASHNSFEFNGIKIFGTNGSKLTDEQEFVIEKLVQDKSMPYPVQWGDDIGRISDGVDLVEHYIDHLVESTQNDGIADLKIAFDCSNGSASSTIGRLIKKIGINGEAISCQPDGTNINKDCGSTHIENIAKFVKANGFDAGFAFDGDADRCLMVDENGNLIDGDTILAILVTDLKARGNLRKNTFVATVMSNMGLGKFAKDNGITMETTKVGDRYVLERMMEKGYVLGGEQSGHIIMSEFMSTGDGQLTALLLINALKASGKTASQLAGVMKTYPQALRNIRADASMKAMLDVDEGVLKIIEKAKKQLGDDGRILVRPSGTEPLIRIMIEGADLEEINQLTNWVAESLEERLRSIGTYKPLNKE